MANGIKTRPVRRMTQAELDGFLEKAADILRGNVDHSEFRGYVFALLFFRRISDLYQEEVAALTKKLGDEELARDPKMHNFVVPEGCLWEEVARKNPAQLVPEHEAVLVAEIQAERQAALTDIDDAYDPVIEPLPELKGELARLQLADFDAWLAAPNKEDVHFGSLKPLVDDVRSFGVPASAGSGESTLKRGHRTLQKAKAELRAKAKGIKDTLKARFAEVKRAVKELGKLDEERAERLAEINAHADRHNVQVVFPKPGEVEPYFLWNLLNAEAFLAEGPNRPTLYSPFGHQEGVDTLTAAC